MSTDQTRLPAREQEIEAEEALLRFQAGRPARDDAERTHYREYRTLDADGFRVEGRSPRLEELSDQELHDRAAREIDERRARRAELERARSRDREPELDLF